MANYASSLLVTGQAKLLSSFANAELRYRTPATFQAFMKNSAIMFPDGGALRTREDRATEAYYKKRTSRALGSARAHNHTGVHGDSGVLTPSWVTKTDKFSMALKQADKNIFAQAEMFQNELQNVVTNFSEGLETLAVNHLFANRSGVNIATVEGAFDATNDVFEVTESTNGTRFVQIIKSIMDINKYTGTLDVFCDTVSFNKIVYQLAQGSANSANLTFQFGGVNFIHSPELFALAVGLDATYTKGFVIAVPSGTIGVMDWIPVQNRQGIVTQVNSYSSMQNPILGLTQADHTYETRLDGTSVGGYTQDVATEFEFSVDIALANAPLSVATETTLQAFALI